MNYESVRKEIISSGVLASEQHIIIGLSGGPDSMCLFDILKKISFDFNLKLYAVHVNHNLRPGVCDKDQYFVEEECRLSGIPCYIENFDCAESAKRRNLTEEEAGRIRRRKAYNMVAEEIQKKGIAKNSISIALGHHADDQAETVLFRIIRGTGVDGLSGMRKIDKDEKGYRIIRPLLDFSKEEIAAYCEEAGIKYCVDETNKDERYVRNWIRCGLIPSILRRNAGFKDGLLRLADTAYRDRAFFEKLATDLVDKVIREETNDRILADGNILRGTDEVIRHRVWNLLLKRVGLNQDVTFIHFDQLEKLLEKASPSAEINMPNGYIARRVYSDIEIINLNSASEFSPAIKIRMCVEHNDDYMCEHNLNEQGIFDSSYCDNIWDGRKILAVFDADAIEGNYGKSMVVIRHRRPGDFIALKGGTKKIQDLFVDDKVPRNERNHIMLAAIDSEVLYIPGFARKSGRPRISKNYKCKHDSRKRIIIETDRSV